MLNRLFIILGMLVILAIGAAFVVPRFIQWGDYRGRLQTMAASAFGTEVAIEGDIQLTLLPQPKLEFTKVRVGTSSAPVLEVRQVDAEFSLLDFLRDQYKVTKLTLDHPTLNFAIAPDGTIASGIRIADSGGASNVSIANADVTGGALRIIDGRSGAVYEASGINGQLRLDALTGPFNFQGTASVDSSGYGVRVGTGKFDASGSTTLSVFIKASDESFTLESNGALTAGASPKYQGEVTYRRPPPRPGQGEAVDAGRGDFVLSGKVAATPERVLLSDYSAVPDENRAATRLTGAAELKLGKDVSFNAIVSGGVVTLPPRDATKELADPPYELVRLLSETPLPPIPPIPGTVGVDITELNLRAVSLRDVRLDASTDTRSWAVKDLVATLPGQSKLTMSGNLQAVEGRPIFAGSAILASQQLDRLAALWRKPPEGNPLFNQAGSLSADIALSSDTLTLSSGTLVVGGINQGFEAQIGFGRQPRELKLDAHFTTLGNDESTAIAALLPDITANGSFGATFPKGEINLSASKAVLFGLEGTDLNASASWEGGVLEFSKLSAADFGGATFDAKLTAFGTLSKPELSGNGTLKLQDRAPVVAALLNAIKTPPAVADFLRQSLPADVTLQLDAPAGDGGQVLTVSGKLGASDAQLEAKLSAGIASALTAPIAAKLDLKSDSALLMTRQLGLGAYPLFGSGTPLQLDVSVDGAPASSYVTHVTVAGGGDHITFDGNVRPGDFSKISGNGQLEAKIADPGPIATALGAEGLYVPAVSGRADFEFDGTESLRLSRIEANGVSGELALTRTGDAATIAGKLALAPIDARALVPAVTGAASTVATAGSLWPEGPIDIGDTPRTSSGRIDFVAGALTSNGTTILSDVRFGLDWDAQSVHLRNLSGKAGQGTLSLDATVCCSSGKLPSKQVSGRVSAKGIEIASLAPGPIAQGLSGTLDGSAEFTGNGETLAETIATLTGTGSYSVHDATVAHFDPKVFSTASGLTGVVDMTADALSKTVTDALAGGSFAASDLTGGFTIAGGVLRAPNLAVEAGGARIFGGGSLALKDLTLDARYAMTPTADAADGGSIDATTAEVDAVIKGPIWAPQTSYDVASLVEGMKIKASEVELARLEAAKAEADARAKAEAERQARLDVLRAGAKIAAGGQARQLAEEDAARRAAEAAAKAAEAAAKAAASDLGM
ncbi:MAG TPA: AsmA family protein [Devosia sp.]|nr:AsmA family protein [Devosia sp.]